MEGACRTLAVDELMTINCCVQDGDTQTQAETEINSEKQTQVPRTKRKRRTHARVKESKSAHAARQRTPRVQCRLTGSVGGRED